MSVYTTLYITRSKAKELLIRELMGDITDDMLEKFMDEFLEPRLYNAFIVDDSAPNNDDVI